VDAKRFETEREKFTTRAVAMKIYLIVSSPQHFALLLLLATSSCERRVQGQPLSRHIHADAVAQAEESADDAERDHNTEGMTLNGTAYSSSKCSPYMHDMGGGFDGYVIEANYAVANDLKSSCKSRASNARGEYTSKGLCYFAFHKIPDDKVPPNRMSVACSDANLVEESRAVKDDPVEHPVRSWPDTCVGDFPRCYRLDHDEQLLIAFVCSRKLEVPEGATHLSVDCTADKTLLKKMLKNGDLDNDPRFAPYQRQAQKERREYYAFVVALAVAACACCLFCLLLVHRYAFKPYLKALKRTRSDPELAGLTSSGSSRS
jgi:hypothetical protein